jgi:hypothetical protein
VGARRAAPTAKLNTALWLNRVALLWRALCLPPPLPTRIARSVDRWSMTVGQITHLTWPERSLPQCVTEPAHKRTSGGLVSKQFRKTNTRSSRALRPSHIRCPLTTPKGSSSGLGSRLLPIKCAWQLFRLSPLSCWRRCGSSSRPGVSIGVRERLPSSPLPVTRASLVSECRDARPRHWPPDGHLHNLQLDQAVVRNPLAFRTIHSRSR